MYTRSGMSIEGTNKSTRLLLVNLVKLCVLKVYESSNLMLFCLISHQSLTIHPEDWTTFHETYGERNKKKWGGEMMIFPCPSMSCICAKLRWLDRIPFQSWHKLLVNGKSIKLYIFPPNSNNNFRIVIILNGKQIVVSS